MSDDSGRTAIVGEWEGLNNLDVLTLTCSADCTGEAGAVGMQSTRIVWVRVGSEFQITSSTGEGGLVTGVLEEDGSLTLRQPARPNIEPLLMYRRPSPASQADAVANT
jgi:hypothetical protein